VEKEPDPLPGFDSPAQRFEKHVREHRAAFVDPFEARIRTIDREANAIKAEVENLLFEIYNGTSLQREKALRRLKKVTHKLRDLRVLKHEVLVRQVQMSVPSRWDRLFYRIRSLVNFG
jgi:hypothetical protein